MTVDFTFIAVATAFIYVRLHHAMTVSLMWTPSCILLAGMPTADIMSHYGRGLLYRLIPNAILPELSILSQAADVCAIVNVRNGVKLFQASRAIDQVWLYAKGDVHRLDFERNVDRAMAFMVPYGYLFFVGLILGQRWKWSLGLPIGAAVGSLFTQ